MAAKHDFVCPSARTVRRTPMGRTCRRAGEIKENTHPKIFTALIHVRAEARLAPVPRGLAAVLLKRLCVLPQQEPCWRQEPNSATQRLSAAAATQRLLLRRTRTRTRTHATKATGRGCLRGRRQAQRRRKGVNTVPLRGLGNGLPRLRVVRALELDGAEGEARVGGRVVHLLVHDAAVGPAAHPASPPPLPAKRQGPRAKGRATLNRRRSIRVPLLRRTHASWGERGERWLTRSMMVAHSLGTLVVLVF